MGSVTYISLKEWAKSTPKYEEAPALPRYNDGHMTLTELVASLSDEELADAGVTRLPRDRDGVTWEPGQTAVFTDERGERNVTGYLCHDGVSWFIEDVDGERHVPSQCRIGW